MIKVIFDPLDLISTGEAKVRDIAQYPPLIKNCLSSLSEGKNQTVYVAHQTVFQWLKNMASRYPQGTFVFETLDARAALAQRWGMEIPDHVTNEDILQAGLLKMDVLPQPGFTFEDPLLGPF